MYPTTNLQFGQTSPEVKKLQEFLISQGMSIPSGPTNYFGNETKAALTAWQKKTGVAAGNDFGYWGPKSIAMAKSTGTTNPPATTNPPVTNPPAGSVTNITNIANSTNMDINSNEFKDYIQSLIDNGTIANTPEMMAKIKDFFAKAGSSTNTPTGVTASGATPTSHYGDTSTDYATISGMEKPNLTTTNAMIDVAGGAKLVSSNYLKNSIANRPDVMAFYVNALTWGGYTLGDVLNDMKRREMADGGNAEAKKLVIIHPTANKQTYLTTAEGQAAQQQTGAIIPTFNLAGLVDPEILKYGSNVPDDLFNMLVPLQDVNSQEFKDAIANVKSIFYDLANAQLQATNEQQKTIADYNYKTFKEQIDREYNIKLSDNATKAWQQIESLEENFSKAGTLGSGLQNEAVDDYLRRTRLVDQRDRTEKGVREEDERAKRFMNSATPAEIQALIAEDVAKGITDPTKQRAYMWGLVPSQDVRDAYSVANLKSKFPDLTDAELQAYHDTVLDENGNYRSTIYRTYYDALNKNKIGEISAATAKLLKDKEMEENRTYADFAESGINQFSTPYKEDKLPAGAPSGTGIAANAPGTIAPVAPAAGSIPDAEFIKKMAALGINITQEQINSVRKVTPPVAPVVPTGTNVPASNVSTTDFIAKLANLGILTPEQAAKAPSALAALNKPPVQAPVIQPVIPKTSTSTPAYVPPPVPKTSTTTPAYVPPAAPVAPKVVTPTTITTPKKQYANLYDYYTGTSGSYNAWNSAQRLADAKKAGINNYTGTAAQNTQLLKSLTA